MAYSAASQVMEILASTPCDSQGTRSRRSRRRVAVARPDRTPRAAVARVTAAALMAIVLAALVVSWEIARPTLPAPFELAVAGRSPGVALWALRLPMALASVAGMTALYVFLARAAEPRGAAYAVAILATI